MTFGSFLCLESNFSNSQGHSMNYFTAGAMIFGLVVVVVNLKVLTYTYRFSFMTIFVNLMSIIVYFVSLIIVTSIPTSDLYQELVPILSTPNFHLGNILILSLICVPDLIIEWSFRWAKDKQRKKEYMHNLKQNIDLTNQLHNEIKLQEVEIEMHELSKSQILKQSNLRKKQFLQQPNNISY